MGDQLFGILIVLLALVGAVMQCGRLLRHGDIEMRNLEPARVFIRQIVQQRALFPSNRADHLPASFQKLGGHRVAQSARCADDEDAAVGGFHCHGFSPLTRGGGDRGS
jgi:hypothetical protein